MYDANEVSRIANIYVEERVLDARKRRSGSGIGKQLKVVADNAGEFLIAFGQKLKGQPQPAAAPAFIGDR